MRVVFRDQILEIPYSRAVNGLPSLPFLVLLVP